MRAAKSTAHAAGRAVERGRGHQGLLLPLALAVALVATGVFATLALVSGNDLDQARRDLAVQEEEAAAATAELESTRADLEETEATLAQTEAALAEVQGQLGAAQQNAQAAQVDAARRQQLASDTKTCTDGARLASQLIAQNNWPAAHGELARVQPFCDRAAQDAAALAGGG